MAISQLGEWKTRSRSTAGCRSHTREAAGCDTFQRPLKYISAGAEFSLPPRETTRFPAANHQFPRGFLPLAP